MAPVAWYFCPSPARVNVCLAPRGAFVSAGKRKVSYQVFVAAELVDSTPGDALVCAASHRSLARITRRRAEAPAPPIKVQIYDLEAYLRHCRVRAWDLFDLANAACHGGSWRGLDAGYIKGLMMESFPHGCCGYVLD